MDEPLGAWNGLTVRLYGRMLGWYPPRFRREFAGEIHAVFRERMAEGGPAAFALQELAALGWSILREHWHERCARKGEEMETEGNVTVGINGATALRSARVPSRAFWWILSWILSALVVLPLALFATYPFSLPYMWFLNLGVRWNLWPAAAETAWLTLGFTAGLGLVAGWMQWLLLRHYLPGAGRWFAATALGLGLGGIIAAVFRVADVFGMEATFARFWLVFVAIGLMLGLLQWLFLRRSLRHAAWLVPVDLLAAASLLPIRVHVDWTLLLVLMPGVISGAGIWILLQREAAIQPQAAQARPTHQAISWPRGLVRIGVGLMAGAAIFLVSLWLAASAMLLVAKTNGAFPTVEESIIQHASMSGEENGVRVLSISNVEASPAVVDGVRQHVRGGCATIKYDRVPANYRFSINWTCAQYIHTRAGWVQVKGELLPMFLDPVMELYNMEGLREFRAGTLD